VSDDFEVPDHYEYFLLGGVTPVRVACDKVGLRIDAEVPEAASPSGLRHAATYLTRLDQADVVEAIDRGAFETHARVYIKRQKKRNPSAGG
jgi:hypothetical protein